MASNPKAATADRAIAEKHRAEVAAKADAQAADEAAKVDLLAKASKKGAKVNDACQAKTGTAEQQNPNRT